VIVFIESFLRLFLTVPPKYVCPAGESMTAFCIRITNCPKTVNDRHGSHGQPPASFFVGDESIKAKTIISGESERTSSRPAEGFGNEGIQDFSPYPFFARSISRRGGAVGRMRKLPSL
jgi:hypothetical protein